MIEVGENFQRLGDDGVRFLPANMSQEAHTAGVMLVTRIVEALRGGVLGQLARFLFGGSRRLRSG
jgi:hypothetical protein